MGIVSKITRASESVTKAFAKGGSRTIRNLRNYSTDRNRIEISGNIEKSYRHLIFSKDHQRYEVTKRNNNSNVNNAFLIQLS